MDPLSHRVVVTGIGLAAPCGIGVEPAWASLIAGRSAIANIRQFDPPRHSVRIAGDVRDWDPPPLIPKKKLEEFDRFMQFALGAAALACARGVVPLTINIDDQDPECDLDVVPNEARRRTIHPEMSNSL
jgi:3-oxoacyl-(acyl-carrier-protein) synthase